MSLTEDSTPDFWVGGIDAEGQTLWENTFGGEGWDFCQALYCMGNGFTLLAGQTTSFGRPDMTDIWLLILGSGDWGVKDGAAFSPTDFAIQSVAPNPFNNETTVSFKSDRAGEVVASISDLTGREIKRWTLDVGAGEHRIALSGNGLTAGTYWLRLEQGGRAAATKIALVK